MQTRNPTNSGGRVSYANRIDVSAASRFAAGLRERVGLWRMASGSSSVKSNVQKLGRSLSMFQAFGDYTKRQCLDTRNGLISVSAVAHHAGEGRHFRQPPAVIFLFKLN